MKHSNPNLLFEATKQWQDHTAHALLVCASNKARSIGLFTRAEKALHLKMKRSSGVYPTDRNKSGLGCVTCEKSSIEKEGHDGPA